MIQLTYNNLDKETQAHILSKSKAAIKRKYGHDLKAYAKQNGKDYEALLEEEAIRNLYKLRFSFKI